ncbi:TetR/AcrR family transcriptional regulator [Promicromonospora sp. MEB111]|uniref:TetR/AcrR family transcriptional regulator n=1 Tax=Promicromonospora sp. MEB111 TaxID=3040301 RepID=UPI002550C994|nr:TetR/AcrR family transcriptional regulator [Promicromonospora sp. MEB111]
MVRWQPGTSERLQAAALDLFASQGYEQTTAAEIAQSVGLTERTFFRHFSDKREVLFHGQQLLVDAFLAGMAAAPDDATPMELVAAALESAAEFFPDERREHSRLRQTVIDQNPALQERERHKLSVLAATVGEALRARGVTEPAATLAAESGATVFGVAFTQWIAPGETRPITQIERAVLAELRGLAAVGPGPAAGD